MMEVDYSYSLGQEMNLSSDAKQLVMALALRAPLFCVSGAPFVGIFILLDASCILCSMAISSFTVPITHKSSS